MTPVLTVKSITKRFADTHVVKDVSFTVYPSEIFALLGPSGCGKTTTLRIIAGFEVADTGTIAMAARTLASKDTQLPPESRGIGFVFQDYALFPHKNVFENVAFGLRKVSKQVRQESTFAVLDTVGLTDLHARLPHHLSGGEQQRVALARAIIARPKLLLLDEPFSSLDPGLRQSTREEVRSVLKAEGISAVLVTHDQEEALSFADRLGVMKDGTLEQIGTPERVYRYPITAYVADFLGQTNFIRAPIKVGVAETPFGRVQVDAPDTPDALLSIRPECLEIVAYDAEHHATQRGRVVGRAFKGHDFTYQVEVEDETYCVQTDYRCAFQVGDNVLLKAVSAVAITADTPETGCEDLKNSASEKTGL